MPCKKKTTGKASKRQRPPRTKRRKRYEPRYYETRQDGSSIEVNPNMPTASDNM